MVKRERWADLHIHTSKSDGTDSVRDVFDKAAEVGLDVIAITDHDTVAASEEAVKLSKKTGIDFVPGVELSAVHEGREVHVVGLFIDWQDPAFNEQLAFFQKKRQERAKKIIKKLKEHNIDISFEELYDFTENIGNAGRLHIAKLLVHKKIARNIRDAFGKFLSESGFAYVPKAKLTVKEAIDMIAAVGGVSVLAHPGLLERDDMIEKWKKQGLDGIEAYHPDHKWDTASKYLGIAKDLGLLVSGGSDSHGSSKDYTGLGKVKLPYEFYEKLAERAAVSKGEKK